jgi:hypothetical protein
LELLESRVVPSTIDHSSGFASHGDLTANGTAGFTGSSALLTHGGLNQAGSIFTNDKVDIANFTANFTFTPGAGSDPTGGGLAFVIQNSSSTALGSAGSGMGFNGIPNSFAVMFDLGDSGSVLNTTGISTGTMMSVHPLDLHSQDPFQVSLSFDGSTLNETLKDTTTGGTFTHAFSVSIPKIVGSHTAFVGFTGSTGALTSVQSVHTFLGNFGSQQSAPLTATGVSTINGVEGQLLHNVTLGTFTGPSTSTGITATINWGDGTAPSAGFITGPDNNGVFTVSGTHTYAEEGTPPHGGPFVITVTITSGTATATFSVNTNIVEAPLSAQGGGTITVAAGQSFTATVATFTNIGGPEQLEDYAAIITWGDNTASSGTISLGSNNVFSVTGSHTYATAGTFTITTTIIHEELPPVTVTSTAIVFSLAPPLVPPGNQTAVEGQATTFILGTFSQPPAGLPLTITVNWGDNTSSVFPFTGGTLAAVHTYAEESTFHAPGGVWTVTVTATNIFGQSTAATFTVFVADAPLVTRGGNTINAAVGQSFTATTATFVDVGGPQNPNDPGDYNATINWGDNTSSAGKISLDNNSVFSVTGTHAYSTTGTFTISTTINHETAGAFTATSTAIVSSIAPPMIPPANQTGVEGTATTFVLGTFNQTPVGLPLTITVNWGDNTSSTFSFTGGTLSAVHTYVEESTFHAPGGVWTVTVTATNVFGQSTTKSFTVFVADAPLSVTGGSTISATEGQAFSATVATFVDTGGPQNPNDPGDYNATIDWGDNSTSAGTISLDSSGVFSVTGSHTYGAAGTFTITTTINHETAGAFTGTATAVVADAALAASGQAVNATLGSAFSGVVATFTDANSSPNLNNLSASIDWGDGNTSTGTISQNADGSFSVSGSNTYQVSGPFTVKVVINDVGGSTATAMSTASIDMPLSGAALPMAADQLVAADMVAAQFSDADVNAKLGDFVATIDWGDGTPLDTGTVTQPGGSGTPFFVDFTHIYNSAGTFTVHVNITDQGGISDSGGAFIDVFSTATVSAAGAPQAPGGGSAASLGQNLLGANGVQLTGQQFQSGTLSLSTSSSSTPLLTSGSMGSGQSSGADDLYWQLLGSGQQLTGSTGFAADQLALALDGNAG